MLDISLSYLPKKEAKNLIFFSCFSKHSATIITFLHINFSSHPYYTCFPPVSVRHVNSALDGERQQLHGGILRHADGTAVPDRRQKQRLRYRN